MPALNKPHYFFDLKDNRLVITFINIKLYPPNKQLDQFCCLHGNPAEKKNKNPLPPVTKGKVPVTGKPCEARNKESASYPRHDLLFPQINIKKNTLNVATGQGLG